MAALEDEAPLGNHGVEALFAGKGRIFHDAVEGLLACSPADGKGRHVRAEIHGIVAPFAAGHMHAVEVQDQIQFLAVKRYLLWWAEPLGAG